MFLIKRSTIVLKLIFLSFGAIQGSIKIHNNDRFSNQKPIIDKSVSLITESCNLSPNLIAEIENYKDVTNKIFQTILNGAFKGKTYNDLAYFADTFGHRLTGSASLENSIDFMLRKFREDGLENVVSETVTVPHWLRGHESATMILPRKKDITILGLGPSIGTKPGGIYAEVLVVRSFEDLKQNATKAKGKIIVFNQDFNGYETTVKYRLNGAVESSKYGGVATLIRSITDLSINSPHTGFQKYHPKVKKIPTACITVEDAQLLQRLQDRGEKIFIHLKMIDFNLRHKTSRNAFAEIKGREKPDEVVIISGHIDSWDVGQGVMDDAGALFISEKALAVLKFLNLRPRRTLRAVLWTAEEPGLFGVKDYIKRHKQELEKLNVVLESDKGTFKPIGLDFAGTDEAGCIVLEVMKLMSPINATTYRRYSDVVNSDLYLLIQEGVPGISLNTDRYKQDWYHHTNGDTMSVENPNELDLCTALWTAASYVLADLSVSFPRA